jgi:NAD(P)-dependent dehydrogenase (short-subunit alcohol dehydrogenase family)
MHRVILVTGGSRGIGAATAVLAAQQGHDVCIGYVARAEQAQTVVQQIQALGRRALAVQCDVALEADVLHLFAAAQAELGPITGLVNTAGIAGTPGPLEHVTAAGLERLFNVNVIGTILCAREAVKRMSTKQGGQGGVIVNLSSIAARLGAPRFAVAYAASKGAIDVLTLGLAREVADQGIRVNAVSPGMIVTDMQPADRMQDAAKLIPMGRLGQAGEVAASIVWLLSDAAAYVTAANLDVSGGR